MKQMINFDKLFFEYFSNTGKKIFKIRRDVNLNHDIYFLDGLIHDAKFKISDIKNNNKTVKISIERYCNEFVQDGFYNTTVKSILKFTNIKLVNWIMGDIEPCLKYNDAFYLDNINNHDNNYSIDRIIIANSTYINKKPLDLILTGYPYNWQLRIEFHQNWHIELRDLEKPILVK